MNDIKALTWQELEKIKIHVRDMQQDADKKFYYDGYAAAKEIPRMTQTIEKLYKELKSLQEQSVEDKDTIIKFGKEIESLQSLKETQGLLHLLIKISQRFIKDYNVASRNNKDFTVTTFVAELYKMLCPYLMQYNVKVEAMPGEAITGRPTQTLVIQEIKEEKKEEIGG